MVDYLTEYDTILEVLRICIALIRLRIRDLGSYDLDPDSNQGPAILIKRNLLVPIFICRQPVNEILSHVALKWRYYSTVFLHLAAVQSAVLYCKYYQCSEIQKFPYLLTDSIKFRNRIWIRNTAINKDEDESIGGADFS